MITRNTSKALFHSCSTLLHRTAKASSSRSVLPVVTPYSTEGSLRMIRNYTAPGPTPHQCLPQNRIPKGHPSTFPPSQTNIPPFCSQRTPSIIPTGTLMIIARPYPTQLTPPNQHTPFEKGDLIPRKGSSTNLKPTYTSLPLHTSWLLTPCPTTLLPCYKNRVYRTMCFLPQTVDVLNHVFIFPH